MDNFIFDVVHDKHTYANMLRCIKIDMFSNAIGKQARTRTEMEKKMIRNQNRLLEDKKKEKVWTY